MKRIFPKMIKRIQALNFVSFRLFSSRFASSRITSCLGIGIGTLALIVVIAVMNGFQATSINSLLEIGSYHVKCDNVSEQDASFVVSCAEKIDETDCIVPMNEVQGLLVGNKGKQNAAIIRGVPENITEIDSGFAKQAKIVSGNFSLDQSKSVVLGSTLAHRLGVRVGDSVTVLMLSGNSDTELFSSERVLSVTGIFECPYLDINSSFAFTSLSSMKELADGLPVFYGIKLKDKNKDGIFIQKFSKETRTANNFQLTSWRIMNKSFFGALRIEKNVLFLLVLLIFLVVGINIYNGMRRMVFERKEDVCVLYSLGVEKRRVQLAFILQGMYVALIGCVSGLLLGLFISSNMHFVFIFLSKVVYGFQYFFAMLFSPQTAYMVTENYIFKFYSDIPAVIGFWETFYIVIFGLLASLLSSYFASRKVLNFQISEVLRDE